MLKELFELVKNNATESVVNNPEVPNELNDEVVAEATDTVASGLRNMVAGGGLQNIISMFTGGGQQGSNSSLLNNPLVSMMIGHFVGKLTNKFNMNGATANQVATGLIPQVLSSLVNKSNDANDSTFSLEGLLNSITGGQLNQQQQNNGINIQDILGQLGGGQTNGGGLSDIIGQLAGGAQQQQQQNGGGGLMDLIKGFIK